MRYLRILIVAVIGAFAQDAGKLAPRPEIRGVVLEAGSNVPVAEAKVTLEVHGATRPRLMPSPPKSTLTTKTDATGSFVFSPDDFGYFYVQTKKEGYRAMPGIPGGPASSQEVTLSAARPSRELRLFLSRPGEITGLVVDEETGKPVTGLQVGAVRVTKSHVFPFGERRANTDVQGRFVLSDLTPGEFAIEVTPQKSSKERVLSTFSEKDVKTVDQDFEHTYWPGGRSADMASPVLLISGGSMDAGVLRVKKVPYYRVRVRFPGWNCETGETVSIIQQDGTAGSVLAQAPCGRDLLVTGFSPGSHRLMFGIRKPGGGSSGGASVNFVISEENLELAATLERPLSLQGSIVAAEGATLPDVSRISARLGPVSHHVLMMSQPVKADAAGKFRVEALAVEAHELTLVGIGTAHYVKEIRYNGIPVSGNVIPLDGSAITQSLAIVLDDKPAVITGIVMKGDKPADRPRLILMKWPPQNGKVFLPTAVGTADDKGRFQFGGLAPGEYRVIALESQNLADFTFEMRQRALAAAPKIEVGAGGRQNLTVELTELR